jgi:pimeloyl-ACP methyl ester carboxylesterase
MNAITQEFPIPNDILTSAAEVADGTMVDGTDPANPVTTGIGFLDGNSTTAAFDIEIEGSLDPKQELDARSFVEVNGQTIPNPNQNVFVLPLTFPSGDPLLQAEGEVPSFKDALTYQGAAALAKAGDTATAAAMFQSLAQPVVRAEIISLDDERNNFLRINPVKPLDPKTKYLVVITNDVKDASGEPLIAAPSYENYRDTSQPLGNALLKSVRGAVLNWEKLASGYFGFMADVYEQAGLPEGTAPTADDIVFSISFTTTAVDDVLKANAAPRTFLRSKAETDQKQSVIESLNSGAINVTGQPIDGADGKTQLIASRIYTLLTNQAEGFPLFNADLATSLSQANAAGMSLSFSDVVTGDDGEINTTLAFVLQSAAAQASLDTVVPTESGNMPIAAVIASTASGTEATLVGGDILQAPTDREVSFVNVNTADQFYESLPVAAGIAEGEITLPYFQGIPQADAALSENVAALQGYSWQANQSEALGAPSDKVTYRFPFAAKTADVTVPVTVTFPNEAALGQAAGITKPAEGWPVIIFQHGINTDRSTSLPFASTMATACANQELVGAGVSDCYVTIAIDQPLHGISPNGSYLNVAGGAEGPGLTKISDLDGASEGATERHFNYAADPTARNMAKPMSALPAELRRSGSMFINLSNFANTRDNLRQGVIDLLNLNASLSNIDDALDAVDVALGSAADDKDLNLDRVYFVGHSLGTVNGLPFVAVNNDVRGAGTNLNLPEIKGAAALMGGGMVTKLLENSESIAPTILQGLASASNGALVQGTSNLERYFSVFQGLLDGTDPINYGDKVTDQTLFTVAIGDDTIPNEADENPLELTTSTGFRIDSLSAPLAGTEPLVAQFGATTDGLPQVARYENGKQGTPVSTEPKNVFSNIIVRVGNLFKTAN